MQVHPGMLYGTLRLSLGWENTEEQLLKTVDVISNAISEFKEFAARGYNETSFLLFSDTNKTCKAKLAINRADIDSIFAAVPPRFRSLSSSNTALAIPSSKKSASLKALSGVSLEPLSVHDVKGIGKHIRNSDLTRKEHSFWKDVTGS
jgi:hypothetical protein